MGITSEDSFQKMLDVLRGDTIRGVVFSIYDEFGYQNLYSFPPPIENLDVHLPIDKSLYKEWQREKDQFFTKPAYPPLDTPPIKRFGGLQDIALYTDRDFLQIAVKSISLLIGEKVLEKDPSLLDTEFYGILPYPDLQVYSYTFFRFYSVKDENVPRACTFSLLIDKNKKNFIYDNHDLLNDLINTTVKLMINSLEKGDWNSDNNSQVVIEHVQEIIEGFFKKLLPISGYYSHPTPLDEHHSKKIVFTGIPNSGKNSFLITLNRKFSKLINKSDFQKGNIHMSKILGTNVLNWDPDPKLPLLEQIKTHSEIYLDDADIVYFFIDGSNLQTFDESKDLFSHIIQHLKEIRIFIPIVIVISKIDEDIKRSHAIQQNITFIKTTFTKLAESYPNALYYFETSIFNISSCLTAFSKGTMILLRNSNKIKKVLKNYATEQKLLNITLFNEYGLSFSNYVNPSVTLLNYSSSQSFEILGLQLINILEKSKFTVFSKNLSKISIQLRKNLYAMLIKSQSLEPFYIFLCNTAPFDKSTNEFIIKITNELVKTFAK